MAKGTSAARKFVQGSVINIAVIGGIVLAAGYVAKKYNVGASLVSSLTGAGTAAGQSLLAPIQGLVTGVSQGTQGVVASAQSANTALFGEVAGLTDSFNKFFHPDWYNADGSYSSKNPNYNASLPGNGNPSFVTSGLKPTSTSPASDPNTPALNNAAVGVTTVTNRVTGRSTATTVPTPGSNLIQVVPTPANISQATSIIAGTSNPVNLSQSSNVGLKAALNSLQALLTPAQASVQTGQSIVGNYIVPGGTVQPLTQNAVNYYNTQGIRITRVS